MAPSGCRKLCASSRIRVSKIGRDSARYRFVYQYSLGSGHGFTCSFRNASRLDCRSDRYSVAFFFVRGFSQSLGRVVRGLGADSARPWLVSKWS